MTSTNQSHRRRGGARLEKPEAARTGAAHPRTRRRKRKSRKRGWIVCLTVCAVLLGLFLLYRSWAARPELPGDEDAPDLGQGGTGSGLYLGGDRKQDFYTFLIVGKDTGGGGNTDTIMLAAYDIASQTAALMSIPRDTMVNVSWDVKKINSVYVMNRKDGEEAAIAALSDAVAGLVGFRPDYTVTMEWEAVGEIVDAIGGVWFEVPFYMHYADPDQALYIDQQPGYRQLSGADAMQVVRWRKNNDGAAMPAGTDGSDLGRTQVQQDFIAAVLRQCLQIQNVTKINEIASAFTEHVQTKLTVGNLVWFAERALLGGFSTENLYACTMPNTPRSVYSSSYNANLSYVLPNGDELITVVNQYFNPYTQDVTMANLDLMQVNADGSVSPSGGAARGTQTSAPASPGSGPSAPAQGGSQSAQQPEPSPDPEESASVPAQDPLEESPPEEPEGLPEETQPPEELEPPPEEVPEEGEPEPSQEPQEPPPDSGEPEPEPGGGAEETVLTE